MSDFYDRGGNPITLEQWTLLFEVKDYQVVQQDTVGSYRVSTVWLGIDHNFCESGEPLIFETMVFMDGASTDEQRRYSTEEDALAGHAELLNQVQLFAQIAP